MIKVKFFPLQAHSLAFGGFEIQMLTLLENLQKYSDVNAEKIDVWSRDNVYDVAHFWGLEGANFNNIFWAKNNNKKVVITVLLSYYEKFVSIMYDKVSKYIGPKKIGLEILSMVDAVVVVNDLQQDIARRIFKVPYEKVHIIPNIIHDNFFYKSKDPITVKDYILCTGNICQRKNQLNLVKACIRLKKELIIVGKVLPGEEDYGNMVDELAVANSNIIWIKGLEQNSKDLIKLVQECRVFALLSKSETQPISVLEVIGYGKQLLLSDKKFAYQSYFNKAKKINPDSLDSICKGIESVYSNPNLYKADEKLVTQLTGETVALQYEELYKKLVDK